MADFTQINEEINADINTNGANEITGATAGDLAGLDSDGNLTDSGIAANEVATKSDIAYLQQQIDALKNQ